MATDVLSPREPPKVLMGALPGRRYDHLFFSGAALAMLATVFVGFAQSYYLAGVFRAPLPSMIIHLHGAAFSCWILLLVVQTSLVAAGRVDIHRRLGVAGFLLGCGMVVLGVFAATDSLARGGNIPGRDATAFYIVPLTDVLIFGTLLFFAFRARRDSPAHKRYIFIATTALLIAAIARWPLEFSHRNAFRAGVLSYIFLVVLMAYDFWSLGKVHRATLWAGGFLIFVELIRFPIAETAAWRAFASWAQLVGQRIG
jgi:FtsH-binding integral membrane protein